MESAYFINPSGEVVAVPQADLGRVQGYSDWVPASVEQIRDHVLQQQYGTAGQGAIAGTESFGSMLTLGLSTHAETALGVDPEGIKAREEANPLASGTGSAVGILAPLLLTGGASAAVEGAEGASAAARAASMAGPSLLASTGKAVAKAALRELPADASLAQRLAAKGLAAAAGGAVEGAGYEAGQLVHESALGDPNLTAEAALARIGMSAATFGALSGGGSILGALAGEVGGSASLAEKVGGWLEDTEAHANLKQAGGIQSTLAKLEKEVGGNSDYVKKKLLEMRTMGLLDDFARPSTVLERAGAIQDSEYPAMQEFLKSVDYMAAEGKHVLGDGVGVVNRARAEILAPLERSPTTRDVAAKVGDMLDAYAEQWKSGATLEDLHFERKALDKLVRGMNRDLAPGRTELTTAYNRLRRLISEEIDAGVKVGSDASPEALATWKEMNRRYEVASTAVTLSSAGLKREIGNNRIPLMEGMGLIGGAVAGNPVAGLATAAGTAVARRYGSAALGWMARGLRGLLEGEEGALVANGTAAGIAAERQAMGQAVPGAAVAAGMPPRGVVAGAAIAARAATAPETAAALAVLARAKAEVTAEVDSVISGLLRVAPAAAGRTAAALAARAGADAVNVRRLANSPELLLETLARQTDELHGHAPGIAQAAQLSAAQRIAFLASKAPASALPGLHAKAAKPNTFELAKFGRYADVIRNPLRALEHARRGTLTPQHVAALRIGWPATYQHVQERTLWALMGHGGKGVPPASRLMLSMLTGFQLDATLAPGAIAANQTVYARQANRSIMDQSMPTPNPNAGKINQANRVRTPTQGLSERLNGGK